MLPCSATDCLQALQDNHLSKNYPLVSVFFFFPLSVVDRLWSSWNIGGKVKIWRLCVCFEDLVVFANSYNCLHHLC